MWKYGVYLFVGGLISLSLALSIGLFELPDGFFYYVLGAFILYDRPFNVFPLNATIPQTLYGPLYSLFTAFFISKPFPWAMTGITFIQTFSLCLASLWIYLITKILVGKKWAMVAIPVFLLLPFLLVYATSLMSEAITVFLVSTFCLLLTLILTKKTHLPPSVLVFMGCVLTLTKNAYVLMVILSVALWLYFLWRDRHTLTLIKGGLSQVPVLVGFCGILLWIQFNKTHHGIYGLTNYTGRHLYNNVVHSGKLLPDKESAIYKEFISKMGVEENLYLPEWEALRFFVADFHAGILNEAQLDAKFRAFSIAAIKHQPVRYLTHVLEVVWGDLTTAPYHAKLLARLGEPDPTCPECGPIACHVDWNPDMCQPQLPSSLAYKLWAGLIHLNRLLYPWGMIVLTGIAAIGAIHGAIKKNLGLITLTLLFLVFLFLQAAAQRIEGRYLITLYPMYAILIVNGIKTIYEKITR